jgi:hypothetical protein
MQPVVPIHRPRARPVQPCLENFHPQARRRNGHAAKPNCAAAMPTKTKENGVPGGTPLIHIP